MTTAPEQRIPTSHCARCRARLARGHRVHVAHLLPREIRRQALFHEAKETLSRGEFELSHVNCADPALGEVTMDQHVGFDTCGRCRKKFKLGERVMVAFIVEAVNVNPEMPTAGLQALISGNKGEMIHADCADPMLNGKVILV